MSIRYVQGQHKPLFQKLSAWNPKAGETYISVCGQLVIMIVGDGKFAVYLSKVAHPGTQISIYEFSMEYRHINLVMSEDHQ